MPHAEPFIYIKRCFYYIYSIEIIIKLFKVKVALVKYFILFFFQMLFGSFFLFNAVNAQKISRHVICASAETVKVQGFSITYVLGEAVGDLFGSPIDSRFLTAGFNQPDIEIKEVLDKYPNTRFIVYDNPTRTGFVKLAFNKVPNGTYTVQVIDVLGRKLQQIEQNIANNNLVYLNINVAGYASGVYLLRIQSNVNVSGELKLIKQ